MSKDEKGGLGSLWSSATGRKKSEPTVVPMERPKHGRDPSDRTYAAFTLGSRTVRRMEIRRASEPTRGPAYAYLMDYSYDRFHDSALSLVYNFMVVHIEGRNLEPVMHAILSGKCARITEFAAREHDTPDPGAPLIERIAIIAADEALMKRT